MGAVSASFNAVRTVPSKLAKAPEAWARASRMWAWAIKVLGKAQEISGGIAVEVGPTP